MEDLHQTKLETGSQNRITLAILRANQSAKIRIHRAYFKIKRASNQT
jgi:hypothetical protein